MTQEKSKTVVVEQLSELLLELSNLTFYLRRHPVIDQDAQVTVKDTFKRCKKRLKEIENVYKG